MTEQDKQTIERLATLMGWKKTRWSPHPVLWAIPPGPIHPPGTINAEHVFPPSRLDGNGMLWLMGEMEKQGFKMSLLSDPSTSAYPCETIAQLPAYVNEQAVRALEASATP